MIKRLLNKLKKKKGKDLIQNSSLLSDHLPPTDTTYQAIFETSQDGILIIGLDNGKLLGVNPYLLKLLDYNEEDLLGKEIWSLKFFKDIAFTKVSFLDLINKNNGYLHNLNLIDKDNRHYNIDLKFNLFTLRDNKFIQINIRDITEQIRQEKEIEERNKELEISFKFQEDTKKAMLNVLEDLDEAKTSIELEKAKAEAMLESIGEGIIAVDNNKKIIIVNKAAENILGLKIESLLGQKISNLSLLTEEGTKVTFDSATLPKNTSKDETYGTVLFYERKDKSRFPIAMNITPITLGDKNIGEIDIFRDISIEKEIDKAKSEFVSLASHQLRTPLGIMKWYLEALEDTDVKKDPETAKEYYTEISKNNERILVLVRNLLSVSRIDQGKVRNDPEPISIPQIVKETVEQMLIISKKKNVELSFVLKSNDVPLISIDSVRFHELIENLVANAIEYTLSKGIVTVTLQVEKDNIVIAIKDNGIGVSLQDQKKLFTKFFRTERAVTHNPEGSGLGLYVAKSYIEGWGGKITVESKEGKGSTFTIFLPIKENK